MAQVTRQRTGELVRALMVILSAHPDGISAAEAMLLLKQKQPPTDFEASPVASGGERYSKIVRWSTVDCVKAGWMLKKHGIWHLTDAGSEALSQYPDPETFYRRAVTLYQEWSRKREVRPVGPEPEPTPDNGDTNADITYEDAEEQAWTVIERFLTTMPPYEFQEVVASLLRGMGYHVGWIAPPGKDGGVDILAFTDPLGTRPPRIKVQVKRQAARVSVEGLRSFMAVLAADDVGIFVNSGGFTRDAIDEARAHHGRRVTLVDLEQLVELYTQHYGQLDDAARRRFPLQPIYFLAPES